jgi:hypothetical protein
MTENSKPMYKVGDIIYFILPENSYADESGNKEILFKDFKIVTVDENFQGRKMLIYEVVGKRENSNIRMHINPKWIVAKENSNEL